MGMKGGDRPPLGSGLLVLVAVLVWAAPAALGAEGELGFIEAEFDGATQDGLAGASDAVVSPDGKHVYVAGTTDDSVVVLERDPIGGGLTFLQGIRDGFDPGSGPSVDGLDGTRRLAISPDGNHVYLSGSIDDAIAIFSRGADGLLTFVNCVGDGAGPSACDDLGGQIADLNRAMGMGISPDGENLYATAELDNAVTVFTRNQATGELGFVQTRKQGVAGVDGLAGAVGVEVSPDGEHVYTASYAGDAVSVFNRNQGTGGLAFVETHEHGQNGVLGLDGGDGPEISPDGTKVYASGDVSDSIATFTRNLGNGRLTFRGFVADGSGPVDGLNGATLVAISPDGKHLYGPGEFDNALALFRIGAGNGLLAFLGAIFDPADVNGISGAEGVAVAPDGAHVYVPGRGDNAIAAFARERDVSAPQTTIESGPADTTNDPTPRFAFSSPDPFAESFQCSVDGGAFAGCASPRDLASLSDGPHSFAVRARDTAGNVDASPATRAFAVDTVAPAVAFTKQPKNRVFARARGAASIAARKARVRYRWVADERGARFECKLDRKAWKGCGRKITLRVKAQRGKGKKHRFKVRATDEAGNTGKPTVDRFRAKRRR